VTAARDWRIRPGLSGAGRPYIWVKVGIVRSGLEMKEEFRP
jgi:hypothetical protein